MTKPSRLGRAPCRVGTHLVCFSGRFSELHLSFLFLLHFWFWIAYWALYMWQSSCYTHHAIFIAPLWGGPLINLIYRCRNWGWPKVSWLGREYPIRTKMSIGRTSCLVLAATCMEWRPSSLLRDYFKFILTRRIQAMARYQISDKAQWMNLWFSNITRIIYSVSQVSEHWAEHSESICKCLRQSSPSRQYVALEEAASAIKSSGFVSGDSSSSPGSVTWLILWSWAICLTFQNFSFPNCKTGWWEYLP